MFSRAQVAQRYLDQLDSNDLIDDDLEVVKTGIRSHRRRWVGQVARKVKLNFGGTPKDTEANRLAIWREAVRTMKQLTDGDHRTTHMTRDLPIIVELVLIPTEEEIEAKRVSESWQFLLRRRGVPPSGNEMVPAALRPYVPGLRPQQ
jgi:hypothetical protein